MRQNHKRTDAQYSCEKLLSFSESQRIPDYAIIGNTDLSH